jgi:murein DD-endopeptidase MepM/ murein hydrolase activator NlpD
MRLSRWFVTIIPPSNRETRSFGVSPGALKAGVFALVLALVLAGLWVAEFMSASTWRQRAAELQVENDYLQGKLTKMNLDVADLSGRVRKINVQESRLRQMFDLAEVPEGVRELGVGGIDLPSIGDIPGYQKQIMATELNLAQLDRMVELETETWTDAETSILDQQQKLRHTPTIIPTDGWISRGYGYKIDPFTGQRAFHAGLDIACNKGTHIVSPADGVVEYAGWKAGLGIMVKIDHGYGYATIYGHMSKNIARTGDRVSRGDSIGEVGSTGHSTGPHLHYEVWKDGRAENPYHYIQSRTFGEELIID